MTFPLHNLKMKNQYLNHRTQKVFKIIYRKTIKRCLILSKITRILFAQMFTGSKFCMISHLFRLCQLELLFWDFNLFIECQAMWQVGSLLLSFGANFIDALCFTFDREVLLAIINLRGNCWRDFYMFLIVVFIQYTFYYNAFHSSNWLSAMQTSINSSNHKILSWLTVLCVVNIPFTQKIMKY